MATNLTDITPLSDPIGHTRDSLRVIEDAQGTDVEVVAMFTVLLRKDGSLSYEGCGKYDSASLLWAIERFKTKLLADD